MYKLGNREELMWNRLSFTCLLWRVQAPEGRLRLLLASMEGRGDDSLS